MPKLKDLAGQTFGRLTVMERAPTRNGKTHWWCQCSCGVRKAVSSYNLTGGNTRSCGCLHKERLAASRRKAPGEAGLNTMIRQYRSGARARGLSWDLTREAVRGISSRPCHYCGQPPATEYVCAKQREAAREHAVWVGNGIDRVDSSRGYTLDNVVPCCTVCNYRKSGASYEEFVGWIHRAAAHLKE